MDPRPAFHHLAEDDKDEQVSGGLKSSGPTKRWRRLEESHRSSRLGSGGEREADEHVPRRFKGPGGRENIKNYGQQVMSVRTPDGFVRKITWQVADVRRPLVSASHIIQAGNDLFIGKDEAFIMNRKKQEKSMLRKKGNVTCLICS